MERIILCFFLCLLGFLTIGCADLFNCDGEMADARKDHGSPEEVGRYDASGYHSETWWYWSQGFSITFTWGGAIGACEISTYSFSD